MLIIQNFFFSLFRNSTQNIIKNVFFSEFWFVTTNHFKLKIYFLSFLKWFADKNEIIFRIAMTLSKMIVSKFLSQTVENSKTYFWIMQISNLLNFLKQTLNWNSFWFRSKMKFVLKLWWIANNFQFWLKIKFKFARKRDKNNFWRKSKMKLNRELITNENLMKTSFFFSSKFR